MTELFQFKFTNELFSEEEIEFALKLKESVEYRLHELEKYNPDGWSYNQIEFELKLLQSIVKIPRKTVSRIGLT